MSNHCETIQSNISDNIDAGHPISASELDHVDHCSECNQFYQFLHGTSFQDLAAQPAEENFDIDQIKQAAEIMAKLKLTDSQQRAAKRKVINLTAIGAAAAALAVSLSSAFYSSEVAETVATEPKSNVHQISNFAIRSFQNLILSDIFDTWILETKRFVIEMFSKLKIPVEFNFKLSFLNIMQYFI